MARGVEGRVWATETSVAAIILFPHMGGGFKHWCRQAWLRGGLMTYNDTVVTGRAEGGGTITCEIETDDNVVIGLAGGINAQATWRIHA